MQIYRRQANIVPLDLHREVLGHGQASLVFGWIASLAFDISSIRYIDNNKRNSISVVKPTHKFLLDNLYM